MPVTSAIPYVIVHRWLASSLVIGWPSKPFCWLIRLIDKQFSGLSTRKLAFVLNVWSKYSLRSKFGWLKIRVFISIYLTQICYRFRLLLKYRVGAVLENWPPFHSQLCYAVKILHLGVFERYCYHVVYTYPTHCLAQELTIKFWSPTLQRGTISNSQHTNKPYIASPLFVFSFILILPWAKCLARSDPELDGAVTLWSHIWWDDNIVQQLNPMWNESI